MDKQRSTFVTVIGWLFVVLSGLGMLESLLILFTPMDKILAQAQQMQQAGAVAPDAAAMASVMRGVFFFIFVVELWVLLSSFGLVFRKEWARISFIVVSAIGLLFSLIYVLVGLAGRSMPAGAIPGASPEMAGFTHALMGAMAIMGALFAVLFVFIIYKLNTAKVKGEFLPTKS